MRMPYARRIGALVIVAGTTLFSSLAPPLTAAHNPLLAQPPTDPKSPCVRDVAGLVDILWLPPEATIDPDDSGGCYVKDGRRFYIDNSASLSFDVVARKEDVTKQVVAHFKKLGWRQRPKQLLNPKIATSFKAGWEGRCACVALLDADGNEIRRPKLYKWLGEWENQAGDFLYYDLRARDNRVDGLASYYSPGEDERL